MIINEVVICSGVDLNCFILRGVCNVSTDMRGAWEL